MNMNKTRLGTMAGLAAACILFAPGASAILVDAPDPVSVGTHRANALVGTVQTCVDYGTDTLYDVADHSEGATYSVVILKQIGGSRLRAAWNSQLPATYLGVNTYISQNFGSYFGVGAYEQAQTGTCGELVGVIPSTGSARVKVHFGGFDFTYQSSSTSTFSFTLSVESSSKFELSIPDLGIGVSNQFTFGASGTWTASTTTTVTYTGRQQTFISNSISRTSLGPIETVLEATNAEASSSAWTLDGSNAQDALWGAGLEMPEGSPDVFYSSPLAGLQTNGAVPILPRTCWTPPF